MTRPFSGAFLALVLVFAFAPATRSALNGGGPSDAPYRDDTLAYIQNLPVSNPYREVLLRYQTLPKSEREALGAWIGLPAEEGAPPPTLTSTQTEIVRQLSGALVAAGSAPPTSRSDWPLLPDPNDPDNPATTLALGIGTLRTLAKLSAKDADTLPPGESIAAYAAIAQLGRQQRSGATLIEQLAGVAIEGIGQAALARQLNKFSPEDLARVSALWSALKPPPSNAEAFAGERDEFFGPMVENVVIPGLRALLDDPQAGLETDEETPDVNFTKDLRLSALMDLGGGQQRVVLENTRSGETLPLGLGHPADGIELVSLDYEKRRAVIRRGSHEALVHLESKRIVARKSPALSLREMLNSFDMFDRPGAGATALTKILELVRKHPGGPEAYGKELLAAYQASIDRDLQLADSSIMSIRSSASAAMEDPIMRIAMPTLGQVARSFNNISTQSTMLQAAIQLRLKQLGHDTGQPPVTDPWAADPFASEADNSFAFEKTPDGGFLLRSRYEVNAGQPVTYKFAAPDAGFVRVSKP